MVIANAIQDRLIPGKHVHSSYDPLISSLVVWCFVVYYCLDTDPYTVAMVRTSAKIARWSAVPVILASSIASERVCVLGTL